MLRFVILGIIIFGLSGAFGANILVLEGLPSPSHHLFFRTVNEALVAQGHNVTSMSADIDTNPVANLTHLHNDKVYEEFYKTDGDEQFNMMNFGQNGNINTLIDKVEMFVATLAGVRKSKGYHQLLAYPDDFHFDLVIYDYMALPVLLGFQHKFKNPPLIIMSAFSGIAPTLNFVGSSLYPAYIPFYFGTSATETFFGRVENTFVYYFDYFYRQYYALPKIHAIAKQDFPDLPPFADLERQTRLAMINYSPAVYQPEPVLPNVIPIAGMHLQKTSTLPKDLQDILDHAQNGLILFSMGTNVKSWMLGEERIQKFIEAFRKLPQYTFLWKFDDDQLSNVPKNVIIRKWIPQNDVLTHPNTKLFMSHCGLLSSLESTWHGVPILAVPVFLDQFTNADQMIKAGIAEKIMINSFTSDEIYQLVQKMMTSSDYRDNARIRSRLFRDQPISPKERMLWWIEFIIRNPDVEFLRSNSIHLNILTLHNVDVISFFTVAIMSFLYLIYKITMVLTNSRKSVVKKMKNN